LFIIFIINVLLVPYVSPSFVCPKEGARKWHPGCPGLSGFLMLLTVNGTLKNSATPQTILTSYPVNSFDAQRDRMGLQKQTP
jgi:hypothetical protein